MTTSEDASTSRVAAASSGAAATAPVPPTRNRRRRVTELRCGEVRWFYRRKDIDSKWIPFKGQDSLRLEMRWRLDHDADIDAQASVHAPLIGSEVVVLDGLYRMSDDHAKISAVYWKDDEAELRRGSWFLPDGQPIQSSMAESVEAHHLQHFRGQFIPEGTSMFSDKEASRKPQLTELQLPENIEVKWSSVIDVFMYSTTKTSRFLRYVTWGKDTKLRRGYEREADWDDGSPEVSHLILVVHGIGQKGYENLIAKNTEQVRDCINQVMEKQFADEKSRPMLLPVEWRSQVVLDDDIINAITLTKMSSVRNTLNATAMDIMYYQSPLYRKEIIQGVVRSINHVYSMFKKHNPNYGGPVSIFAHSLGSVISYDIITNWSPFILYDQYVADAIKEKMEEPSGEMTEESAAAMRKWQESREGLQETLEGGIRRVIQSKEDKLDFYVENLFCVGSPLGVFLVMRGAEAETVVPTKEQVGRIFNIFHPYDPVAYRLEPLYEPALKDIRPIKIFTYSDTKAKGDYDSIEPDVTRIFMKRKKAENKKAKGGKDDKKGDKSKLPDPPTKGKQPPDPPPDEFYDEDDDDSDDDSAGNARSGCSSPRSLSPPREEAGKNSEKTNGAAKSSWWFKSNGQQSKKDEEKVEKAKEAENDSSERVLSKQKKMVKKVKKNTVTKKGKNKEAAGYSSNTSSRSRKDKKTNVRVSKSKLNANIISKRVRAKRFRRRIKIPEAEARKMTEAQLIVASIPEERRPRKRIDYSVQPALTDKSYWSVLKSHFSYWTNPDLSMFIVNAIYRQRQEAEKAATKLGMETDKDAVSDSEATPVPSAPAAAPSAPSGADAARVRHAAGAEDDERTPVAAMPTAAQSARTTMPDSPLSVLHLPTEEHLLPDAPGRLPTPGRQSALSPATVTERPDGEGI